MENINAESDDHVTGGRRASARPCLQGLGCNAEIQARFDGARGGPLHALKKLRFCIAENTGGCSKTRRPRTPSGKSSN
jgi:hypothetical protein